MLKFVKISTMLQVSAARNVFYKIFPEEVGRDRCMVYIDSIKGNLGECNRLEYYIIMEKNNLGFNEVIGLTGIYSVNNKEAWLGWYGVVPSYRNRGYGRKILNFTLNKMKEYGYDIVLLYTEKINNKTAFDFYKKEGFIEGKTYVSNKITEITEEFTHAGESAHPVSHSSISYETVMFKSLTNIPLTKWEGKPVF